MMYTMNKIESVPSKRDCSLRCIRKRPMNRPDRPVCLEGRYPRRSDGAAGTARCLDQCTTGVPLGGRNDWLSIPNLRRSRRESARRPTSCQPRPTFTLLCLALLILPGTTVSAFLAHSVSIHRGSDTNAGLHRYPELMERSTGYWETARSSTRLQSSVAASSSWPSPMGSSPAKSTFVPVKKQRRTEKTNRDEIRKLFGQAKTLEKQGQWLKAVQLLERILSMDPLDAHSHLALARLQARRGRNATPVFEAGTLACPDSVHLWQAWAVYEDTVHGHTSQAVQLFERALQLDPVNPYVCHAYGLMTFKTCGRPDEARSLWERALAVTSTAALVCSLGELLIAERDYQHARDLYAAHVGQLSSERETAEVYLAWAWLEERYLHNLDRAEELIATAVTCSPRSSVAQIALARCQGRRQERMGRPPPDVRDATVQRLATACGNMEQRISQSVEDGDGRLYNAWAQMEVKARRYREARKILVRGLALFPRDYSLLQAAGKVEERLGNFTGAIELYGASLSIQPSAPTLVAYALLQLQRPRTEAEPLPVTTHENTKRLFEEALLVDKRHGPAYNAYGRFVFEHLHDEDEARRIFERGLRVNCTDSASIYHGYARLELALGNVNRARDLLWEGNRQVRRMTVGTDSPHRDRAIFLTHTLGMLELNANRPSASLEVFHEGIDRFGNTSQLLLGAALCEVKLGNEAMARELFERSVVNDDKHAQAWQAWGVMEMKAGNLKTAKTLFECGIRRAPKHGALWHTYGLLEQRLGNIETARALFTKGIEVSPKFVPLLQSWASLELREGNFNEAKALIAQALTLDKRHGSGWLISAEIEERLGNQGIASLLLRRGIECSPMNAQLYRALGDALVRQGKILEAREIFERGIDVDPMHAPLYHALAELEARVFNIEGLANLNKRAASIFNTNALEPAPSSSEVWGSKIRAGRSQALPRVVAALAQRIVEEEGDETRSFPAESSQLLDRLLSPTLLEEGIDMLGIGSGENQASVGKSIRQSSAE